MADVEDLQRSLALAKVGLVAPEGARARIRARMAQGEPVAAKSSSLGSSVLGKSVRARAWMLGLMGLSFLAGYWLRGAPVVTEPQPVGPQPVEAPSETVAASLQPNGVAPSATPSLLEQGAQAAELDAPRKSPQRAARSVDGASRSGQGVASRKVPRRATLSAEAARPDADGEALASSLAAPDGLAGEVALLQRVERAIRAREGELALALLGKHEHDYPASSLREERAAARVLAACVARPGSEANVGASDNARRYLAGRAPSVYADRVRTLCVPDRDGEPQEAPSLGH